MSKIAHVSVSEWNVCNQSQMLIQMGGTYHDAPFYDYAIVIKLVGYVPAHISDLAVLDM